MSVKLPNGEISRSMPEQVGKNMRDIEELKTGYNQISNIAIVGGHLIVTLQDGTEFDTGAIKGIDTIAFNGSRHLIVTYDDGTTADLGLIKGVSSMSINGSQHLIVTYDDGTTEDLGAIFTGDISISGDITASGTIDGAKVTGNEIVEKMSGYSYFGEFTESYITPKYAGAVKNGNKLTIAFGGTINVPTGGTYDAYKPLGDFYLTIPASVLSKIIPLGASDNANALECKIIQAFNTNTAKFDINALTFKASGYGGSLHVMFYGTDGQTIVNEKDYAFRYEITFLLSDSLS